MSRNFRTFSFKYYQHRLYLIEYIRHFPTLERFATQVIWYINILQYKTKHGTVHRNFIVWAVRYRLPDRLCSFSSTGNGNRCRATLVKLTSISPRN